MKKSTLVCKYALIETKATPIVDTLQFSFWFYSVTYSQSAVPLIAKDVSKIILTNEI